MKTLHDFFTSHERGYTFVKAGALGGAALALATYGYTTSIDKPTRTPYAVCTGEQDVPVAAGNTLSGLIEAHVETPPTDRLKSSGNLELLAHAVSTGDDTPQDSKLNVYRVQKTNPDSLVEGDTITLPEECHVVEDEQ